MHTDLNDTLYTYPNSSLWEGENEGYKELKAQHKLVATTVCDL